MPEKGKGLYTSPDESSFKSDKQIKYENLDSPILIREKTKGRKPTFYEWIDEFTRRRDLKTEVEGVSDEIEITFETNEPVIWGLVGDIHGGGYEVDYELLAHDIAFIASRKNAYLLGGGDWTDSFFFNPAQNEMIASYNQQRKFVMSMVKELGEGKILALLKGDHDNWASKMGTTIYDEFRDRTNIPIIHGTTKIRANFPDIQYKIVGGHQLPGSSMYNDSHPENRESKFGIQQGDIYMGWHNHKKAIAEQVADGFDGDIRQLYIASGAYKYSDEYSKKKGWSKQGSKKHGAVWLVLTPFNKNAQAFYTAEEAERYL
ncbi:TPA: hypothetical protein DEP90_02805 [Patescibacteria group bacterium]|nr:hypothetical protein [Patescibacteria group bacterium]